MERYLEIVVFWDMKDDGYFFSLGSLWIYIGSKMINSFVGLNYWG